MRHFLKKLQILNGWRGFYFVILPVAEHDSACTISFIIIFIFIFYFFPVNYIIARFSKGDRATVWRRPGHILP